MTDETDRDFNDRRALDEQALADRAPDVVQAIAHGQLSRLHAQQALEHQGVVAANETALDVTAIDGTVTIAAAAGGSLCLTPSAANLTSDRLLARARDATRQSSAPCPG